MWNTMRNLSVRLRMFLLSHEDAVALLYIDADKLGGLGLKGIRSIVTLKRVFL